MPPNRIHYSPDLVFNLIEDYFNECEGDAGLGLDMRHPTPAGLAYFLGYNTSGAMLTIAKNDPPNEEIPRDSIDYIQRGLLRLEMYYTEKGLADMLPLGFTKLMMSAYLDINEKTVKKEEHDQTITITWQGSPPAQIEAKNVVEVEYADIDDTGDIVI